MQTMILNHRMDIKFKITLEKKAFLLKRIGTICTPVHGILMIRLDRGNKYFTYFLHVLLSTSLLGCPAEGKRTFVAPQWEPHGQLVLSTSASTPEPSITSSPITFTNVNTKVRIQVQLQTQMCKQIQSVSRPFSIYT